MIRDLPLHEAIPRVLPDGWTVLEPWGDGNAYRHRCGLAVLVSTAEYPDGRDWMHISVSRRDRIPNWGDLTFIKNTFAPDRYAYQVLPPPDKHVNLHEYVLHLWVPLTGEPPLPDFTRGLGTI